MLDKRARGCALRVQTALCRAMSLGRCPVASVAAFLWPAWPVWVASGGLGPFGALFAWFGSAALCRRHRACRPALCRRFVLQSSLVWELLGVLGSGVSVGVGRGCGRGSVFSCLFGTAEKYWNRYPVLFLTMSLFRFLLRVIARTAAIESFTPLRNLFSKVHSL